MQWKISLAVFLLIGLLPAARAVDWYVATNGTGTGTTWAAASNDLQGIILNASVLPGDTIWVSNGVYATGGITNYPAGSVLTNRLTITKAVTVRSKDNNPANTIIKGAWDPATTNGPAAVRCVYMSAGSLIGFTITNGATLVAASSIHGCGGGIYCPDITPVISNCIIIGNAAYGGNYYGGGGTRYGTLYNCILTGNRTTYNPDGYASGGGASYSYLYNCILTGNSAAGGKAGGGYMCNLFNCIITSNTASGAGGTLSSTLYNCLLTGNSVSGTYGGGANGGTLYNCTLTGNTAAGGGGGVYNATLYNCIVYFNSGGGANLSNCYSSTLIYSCTSPTAAGAGNIDTDPMLVDKGSGFGASHVPGNYRLSARSPCINTGTNFSWMTSGSYTNKDLDGRQRLRYGTADMGAFEHIRAGTVYGVR